MSKPLAGKRYFDARGRSDEARGVPYFLRRQSRQSWPQWAKQAYCRGRLIQPPIKR